MICFSERGRCRRALVALVWGAAFALVAGTAGAVWNYADDGVYRTYYWDTPSNYKFRYTHSTTQWSHWSSIGSTWYAISATGRSVDEFIGDGSYHDLGNGFRYSYVIASNSGWFLKGSAGRFSYLYTPGQWRNYSTYGGWQNLGNAGLSASFMGDGASHTLGNGFNYSYLVGSDSGWFIKGTAGRFSYLYTPGQWRNYSSYGGWQSLGNAGLSASFMGDGASHTLGNGFSYCYLASSDSGWFLKGSAGRFNYLYTPGQWRNYSTYGGWQNLGNAGLSASFMGDGASHTLGNGFNYSYLASSDTGWFVKGSAGRFSYLYTPGQWRNYSSYGGWQNLGNAGLSASFMGNGAEHDLGNGFAYCYFAADDQGRFRKGSADRFRYGYSPGQWEHSGYGGGWYALGAAGLTAAFLGDGQYHALGDGLSYKIIASTNEGYWSKDGTEAGNRFRYDYNTGQWSHRNNWATWYTLGPAGKSAQVIANAQDYYDLGYGLWYQYNISGDRAWWYKDYGDHNRFIYLYDNSQWIHVDYRGNSWNLVEANLSPQPFWNSGYVDLNNGFWYVYDRFGDVGTFYKSVGGSPGPGRFRYTYGTGQWAHAGYNGAWYNLGVAGEEAPPIWNGATYSFGAYLYYSYDIASDSGAFLLYFKYNYGSGQWSHKSGSSHLSNYYDLGVSGLTLNLLDGGWHGLGNGYSYQYSSSTAEGYWKQDGCSYIGYSYKYSINGNGLWKHAGYYGGLNTLGHASTEWIADGNYHALDTGYSYRRSTTYGWWKRNDLDFDSYRYDYELGEWRLWNLGIWQYWSGLGQSTGWYNPET